MKIGKHKKTYHWFEHSYALNHDICDKDLPKKILLYFFLNLFNMMLFCFPTLTPVNNAAPKKLILKGLSNTKRLSPVTFLIKM